MTRLAACKVALRRDIALHRAQCAAAAARVVQPLEWLDRALAFWRQLSPLAQFAAVPAGILVHRLIFPRRKILRTLVRWGPLVFGAARVIGRAVRTPVESPASSNG